MVSIKNWQNSIEEFNEMQILLPCFDVKEVKQEGQQHQYGFILVEEIFIEDFMQKLLNA